MEGDLRIPIKNFETVFEVLKDQREHDAVMDKHLRAIQEEMLQKAADNLLKAMGVSSHVVAKTTYYPRTKKLGINIIDEPWA